MSNISPETRIKIKGYLEGFIQGLIETYRDRNISTFTSAANYLNIQSTKGGLKPFQAALIPPELIRINQFERGFSTRLGSSIEECARLIALQNSLSVARNYDIKAEISMSALNELEKQKEFFNRDRQTNIPKLSEAIRSILAARRHDDLRVKVVRVDLAITQSTNRQAFYEIKAPKPNKGQCLEVLDRILNFHLITGKDRENLQTYYAMPYNPYGRSRASYKWSHALKYLPFEEVVLVGDEFWNAIGGNGTYEELLDIYMEVGKEKSKYMFDALAFGF